MSDEDEGVPLADALRAFGDPQLWMACEEARAALGRIPPRPRWLRSLKSEREEWSERHEAAERAARDAVDKAWKVLVADFTERLNSIELELSGIEMPLTRDSKRVEIPVTLRSLLLLDFSRSSAKRGTLAFIDVRVRRASLDSLSDPGPANPVEQDGDELTGAAEGTADPLPPGADDGPRRRGQPNLRKQIAAELERRAEQDQLIDLQAEQFRSLEAWAREEQKQGRLPKHRVPKARSIEKSLAKRYQELKAKKSMR